MSTRALKLKKRLSTQNLFCIDHERTASEKYKPVYNDPKFEKPGTLCQQYATKFALGAVAELFVKEKTLDVGAVGKNVVSALITALAAFVSKNIPCWFDVYADL